MLRRSRWRISRRTITLLLARYSAQAMIWDMAKDEGVSVSGWSLVRCTKVAAMLELGTPGGKGRRTFLPFIRASRHRV